MADNSRWRYGEENATKLAVLSATVIEKGDLVYWDGTSVYPASSQTDQFTELGNQIEFRNKFAGVATERSRAGETAAIRVATSGVFEFVCPSTTWKVGDLVGASETGAGTALENQQVESVTRPFQALGRVVKAATSATTVLAAIKSTLFGVSEATEVKFIHHRILKSAMTDGGGTSGNIDLTSQVPANSLVLGWTAIVTTAFNGDTSAVLQVGTAGTADGFSAVTTNSVFAAGTVGCGVKASNAVPFCAAATTVRATITSAADFTNVAAGGDLHLILAYIQL